MKHVYNFVHGHKSICVLASSEKDARYRLLYYLEHHKELAQDGWILCEVFTQKDTDVFVR